MPQHKLNLAGLEKCPSPAAIAKGLRALDPDSDPFGCLECGLTDGVVTARLVVRHDRAIGVVDADRRTWDRGLATSRDYFELTVHPAEKRLWTARAGRRSVKTAMEILTAATGKPVTGDLAALNVSKGLKRLTEHVGFYEVRGVAVKPFFDGRQAEGPYEAKFGTTKAAEKFIADHAKALAAVRLRLKIFGRWASAVIRPTAGFEYSCRDEAAEKIQKILIDLIWNPKALKKSGPGPLYPPPPEADPKDVGEPPAQASAKGDKPATGHQDGGDGSGADDRLVRRIVRARRAAALEAIGEADLPTLRAARVIGLTGDWRRAAVAKRIDMLEAVS